MFNKDAILCINKPKGLSTFDIIRNLRRKLKELNKIKIGHTGTLDPIAEGVVILLFNRATKFQDIFCDNYKLYLVKAILGYKSDTYDIEGELIKQDITRPISEEEIKKALKKFSGYIIQQPPLYSSKKWKGLPSYKWVREYNQKPKLKSKKVYIKSRLLEFNNNEFCFISKVSKGTYIRSLVNDIGEFLGTGAVVNSLIRLKNWIFKLKDCVRLDDINSIDDLDRFSIDINNFLKLFDRIYVSNINVIRKLKNGIKLPLRGYPINKGIYKANFYPVFDEYTGELLAIIDKNYNYLKFM